MSSMALEVLLTLTGQYYNTPVKGQKLDKALSESSRIKSLSLVKTPE